MRKAFPTTIAAGKVWPDSDLHTAESGGFSWLHVEHRSTAAGAADLLVSVDGRIPTTEAAGGYWMRVPPGRWRTRNTAGPHDASVERLRIVNTGSIDAPVLIEVSDTPITDFTGDIAPTAPGGGGVSSATGTKSNVASSAASGVILAANAARKGATVYNDSTAVLFLDLSGGTASSSSYTVQLAAAAYYELPYGFTGSVTGIWAAANGFARVTEFA